MALLLLRFLPSASLAYTVFARLPSASLRLASSQLHPLPTLLVQQQAVAAVHYTRAGNVMSSLRQGERQLCPAKKAKAEEVKEMTREHKTAEATAKEARAKRKLNGERESKSDVCLQLFTAEAAAVLLSFHCLCCESKACK